MTPFRADLLADKRRRRERFAWIVTIAFAVIVIGGGIAAGTFWRWAFSDIPELPANLETLWDVRRESSVTLLDRNGEVIDVRGPLYGAPARIEDLPDHVAQAFIAIEDRRFYEHSGVDIWGAARAVLANLQAGATVQGGSTITMQLVKNLVLTPERSMRRKFQEMRLAIELERRLSKDEILQLYLNRIYFGARAYGIEAAARRYFDKPAAELTLAEAAMLAALPKAPSRLDPTSNLAAAQERAAIVLAAMEDAGFITAEQRAEAEANPAAPIIPEPEELRDPEVFGHVFDFAVLEAQDVLGELPSDAILQISIDPELQETAHRVLTARMESEGEAENAGEAALVALSPDGEVRAMIGGRDYLESQFNRAAQARRQPGSAFKPIVFLAALENGSSPYSVYYDEPIDLEGWQPRNFGGNYRGRVSMQEALRRSINTVAAQIGAEVGPESLVDVAGRLGIETELPPLPALALGAVEVTLLELTSAYATIANSGMRHDTVFLTRISNSRGETLWEAHEGEPERTVEESDALTLSTMMQDVVLNGTGANARLPDRPAAGKTGTSQSFRDAWFIGFTADYVAGVWVGNDDDTPTNDVTGGGLPARLWRDFMIAAHEDLPARLLAAPAPRERTEFEERLAAFYSELTNAFEAEAESIP
ncbi:PBP1A family penicillin-binding protein [Hyphobacterium sp. HN65]|uniref:peptidoglycan glycosyltransferase n=1 Tax=Hyphobacterium lacteum TaxID=3116575 RepID=A0ABU7LU08_9PROT|nr:PBP1A family penicillin-binding protein [Hyphobacterium sp. HN65]MEE2527049.1 PBP1A family penicillin-binding protein [Hyphobacterium sp. HN65]